MEKRIRRHCATQIDDFLQAVAPDAKAAARDRVVAYIHKTVEAFMISDLLEHLAFRRTSTITYYPATRWHKGQGGHTPPGLPRSAGIFYIQCAAMVWALFSNGASKLHTTHSRPTLQETCAHMTAS